METIQFLRNFQLNNQEVELVIQMGKEMQLKKGEDFSSLNCVAKHFYFIQSGLVRSYRLVDGDDFTYSFYVAGDICVDFESVLKQQESESFFEALTDVKLLKFNFEEFEQLYDNHPKIERITRKMAESAYLKLLGRLREFQTETLEQRYLRLIDQNEEVFKQAPLQHIASYLGVKPQSLSRIRAKLSNDKC